MLHTQLRHLFEDEAGGGTVMGLLWFAVAVGVTGVAVDVTDGFRNRTVLQATADATALAAATDLPYRSVALATATTYAIGNIGYETNGSVPGSNEVRIGRWDAAEQSLDTNAPVPDSVMVSVNRSAENGSGVPANFLRIIGLQTWNVTAQAVAQRFIPECLRDGLIARNIVDMSSNNGLTNQICVHGNQGVTLRGDNTFEPGVNVSMPSLDMLEGPADVLTSNPGLQDALRENLLDPRMVSHVDEIMQDFLDPASSVIPDYIDTTKPIIAVDEEFDLSTAQAGRIYYVDCKPNRKARIPGNSTVVNVVIIADCEISVGTGATVLNSVLGSRSGGNGDLAKAGIGVGANVQLGVPDNCSPGGGVQMFSNATILTTLSTSIDGVQMVASGNIELGARGSGVNGISAQAGGDIVLTSDNMFGPCSGGAPDLFTVDYYRLVL